MNQLVEFGSSRVSLILIGAGFLAGFVDAIAGGGGLISLPAFLSLGLPPATALGTNKIVGIATATASTFSYRRAKLFSLRKLLPSFLGSILLSSLGAYLATLINPTVLRPIILGLLIGVGVLILFKNRLGIEKAKGSVHLVQLHFFILVIALYDGFFGPGAGTFYMITFLFLGGLPMLNASAQSRYINLASNLGAILLFSSTGHVLFRLAFPAALASFIGGILGARVALTRGVKLIRPLFILVTWSLIAKLLFDTLHLYW